MTTAPAQLGSFTDTVQWALFPQRKREMAQMLMRLPTLRAQQEAAFRRWGAARQFATTPAQKQRSAEALRALRDAEASYERLMRTVWDGVEAARRAGKLPTGSVRVVDVRTNRPVSRSDIESLAAISLAVMVLIFASVGLLTGIVAFFRFKAHAQGLDYELKERLAIAAVGRVEKGLPVSPDVLDRIAPKPSPSITSTMGTLAVAAAVVAALWFLSRRRAAA